jgi:hypothetical protein
MDYGMIGKIEKAKRYAEERHRITLNALQVSFNGEHGLYHVSLTGDGWNCSCPGFAAHRICPHIMSLERILRPMLKRDPLPYAPGQNVVSDVEKAKIYAEEPHRIQFHAVDVTFDGDNNPHHASYDDTDHWRCDCSFFGSRGVCSHTMAIERILKGMLTVASPMPVAE